MASETKTSYGPNGELRVYERSKSIVFAKTNEPFGGLSNMAGGYPVEVNGNRALTVEALYQACRFPHSLEVQRQILEQPSPIAAKAISRAFADQTRPDWKEVRVKIMRWCLRVKLVQNKETFGLLLRSTDDLPIVEYSKHDDFWGAAYVHGGRLIGRNVLGRLLMELRDVLEKRPSELTAVTPVAIPDFRLLSKNITSVGLITPLEKPGTGDLFG